MPRNRRSGASEETPQFTNITEARETLAEIHARNDGELDGADRERWTAAESFIQTAETRMEHLKGLARSGSIDGPNRSRQTGSQGRDESSSYSRARRTIDGYSREALPDDVRHRVSQAFDDARGADRDRLSDYAACAADPDYLSAFMRILVDPAGGHRSWSSDELQAWQRMDSVRALGVGAAGDGASAAVPLVLDPSVALTSDGSVNPIRQLASTQSILGNRWQGVSSEGVVNDWTLEAQEVPLTPLTFEPPAITTRKYTAFVPFSFELGGNGTGGDWRQLADELRKIFADSVDNQQAVAFATGTGPADGEFAQPEGVVTGLDGTASQLFAGGAFDRDDLLAVRYAVPPRFRANASVVSSLEVQDAAREFHAIDAGVGDVSILTEGNPPTFRGWKWLEYSELDADPSEVGANFLVAGDFNAGYKIVDRVGTSIEIVAHLFGNAGRPTGQRGGLLWGRVGAGVINANALRLLSNGTS